MIQEGKGKIRVLDCTEAWHGITYREDLQSVTEAIRDMRTTGVYPVSLLE
jgi:hypothetical protein